MASIVTFTALWGAKSSNEPVCYLLVIDNFHILLDCGWNEAFNPADIEPLRPYINKINAVLVSHPDLHHIGALPYAVGKMGLRAPVYATIPTYKMGNMFMYDAFESLRKEENFTTWDLDDVDIAFDLFKQLKFSQHFSLNIPHSSTHIIVTPYEAGHMIGGTIWRIIKDSDEILYAVDYNHSTERHLNPTKLKDKEFSRQPSLLITDAWNATSKKLNKAAQEQQLTDMIMKTLRENGNVLLPTDTAGRMLELLLLLEQHWTTNRLSYPLVLLHKVSYNTLEFAKSQLEWMSTSIQNAFDNDRENPFAIKYMRLCHSLQEVEALHGPKVVLATSPCLTYGFSLDLLLKWGQEQRNSIIFTTRPEKGTTADTLLSSAAPFGLPMSVKRRVPLEGAELAEYNQLEREKKAAEAAEARKAEAEAERKALEEQEMNVEDEVPMLPQMHNPFANSYDWVAGVDPSHQKFPMFPFEDQRHKWDDYGMIIDHERFLSFNDTMEEANTKPGGEVDEREVEQLPPSKIVEVPVFLSINCNVRYVDLEGRSDGTSIKKILTTMEPRKLIIVHGTPEATEDLAAKCTKDLESKGCDVITPDELQTVDATSDTNIYKVSVPGAVLKSLNWRSIGSYDVAYFDSTLSSQTALLMPGPGVHPPGSMPDMIVVPVPSASAPPHEPVFVGQVSMSSLKNILDKAGFHTELAAGVLVVNGTVMVQKVKSAAAAGSEKSADSNRITVSGDLSEDYFKVRALLYNQLYSF